MSKVQIELISGHLCSWPVVGTASLRSFFFPHTLDERFDAKVWDLHYGHGEPALSVWVSHNPITTIRMNEKGDLAVAG